MEKLTLNAITSMRESTKEVGPKEGTFRSDKLQIRSVLYKKAPEIADPEQEDDLARKTLSVTYHTLNKTRRYGRDSQTCVDSKGQTASTFKTVRPQFIAPPSIRDPFFLNFASPLNEIQTPGALTDARASTVDGRRGQNAASIPDEIAIRQDFTFRLPVIVAKQENDRVVTHFLENVQAPIRLIEDLMRSARRLIDSYIATKEQLRAEIAEMKQKHEENLAAQCASHAPRIAEYTRTLKDDFIAQQSENFALQKEIALYKKEIHQYHERIGKAQARIRHLEGILFGTEVFALQPDEPYLEEIPRHNLREESRASMELKPLIH
eukprot:TRINITY_DN4397_c0_g1_i1.p1 TRINITY_DN4397_c0_g1~~TRINITY_DN4397_c0_g1_i1.p1  ORF type:complete len:322 (+),score=67.17 TRINITY_DN4397_c0_g1_i1:62-1027(+)